MSYSEPSFYSFFNILLRYSHHYKCTFRAHLLFRTVFHPSLCHFILQFISADMLKFPKTVSFVVFRIPMTPMPMRQLLAYNPLNPLLAFIVIYSFLNATTCLDMARLVSSISYSSNRLVLMWSSLGESHSSLSDLSRASSKSTHTPHFCSEKYSINSFLITTSSQTVSRNSQGVHTAYKRVDKKIKPVPGVFPEDARVVRKFPEDPLLNLQPLPMHPPKFEPTRTAHHRTTQGAPD